MRHVRSAAVFPLAVLAALVAGCAADADSADESANTQPSIASDEVALDGVSVEVRRDPG